MINHKNIKNVRTPLLTWGSVLGLSEFRVGSQLKETQQNKSDGGVQ